jgi:hypothetical protein
VSFILVLVILFYELQGKPLNVITVVNVLILQQHCREREKERDCVRERERERDIEREIERTS